MQDEPMSRLRTLFVVSVAAGWSLVAVAQSVAPSTPAAGYPSRPVKLVVPVPPGGAADFIARTIAPRLSASLGQPVVVENRAGASGAIASDFVAKSAPDGYTLLQNSITTHGIGPHLASKLPYDPMKDLVPVTMLAKLPLIMAVNAGTGWRSVQDLIAEARRSPGRVTFASSGKGGAPHLSGELFRIVAGVDLLHVPYKGSGPAVTDLVGGQVQIMFDGAPSLIAQVQSGKLRVLAAASAERNPLAPDAPTFRELGLPGIEVALWYGVMVPAATPAAVIERLAADIDAALRVPEVVERFRSQATEPMGGSPRQAADFIRAEYVRWGDVIRKAGVSPD
jgi:tripartite-type tricarboxylate transporter receptor subunit TctC